MPDLLLQDQNSAAVPDPLAAAAARIRLHPRFPLAVQHYLTKLLDWRSDSKLNDRQSSTHARSSIIGYLLYLHFLADPTDPDDGATYLKLLDLCTRRGDCGPRLLTTMLALMRLSGHVQQRKGGRDRRLRLYVPTEKLLTHVRAWYANTFGCFDTLVGGTAVVDRVRSDPEFLRTVIPPMGNAYFNLEIQLVNHYPVLFDLYAQEGGSVISALMVMSALEGTEFPRPASIARTFSCSASQIRLVLKFIADNRLADIPDNRILSRDAPIVGLTQDYIARELGFYHSYALSAYALEPAATL